MQSLECKICEGIMNLVIHIYVCMVYMCTCKQDVVVIRLGQCADKKIAIQDDRWWATPAGGIYDFSWWGYYTPTILV